MEICQKKSEMMEFCEGSCTTDGNKNTIIIILGVALGLVVMAGVASILIKVIKDRIIKANTEIDEYNENYGNLTPDQYYEADKQSKVVHYNDYYTDNL